MYTDFLALDLIIGRVYHTKSEEGYHYALKIAIDLKFM